MGEVIIHMEVITTIIQIAVLSAATDCCRQTERRPPAVLQVKKAFEPVAFLQIYQKPWGDLRRKQI